LFPPSHNHATNNFKDHLPNLDIAPSFEGKNALEESPIKTHNSLENKQSKPNNKAARYMNDFFNLQKE
jgi:hypothetical protein